MKQIIVLISIIWSALSSTGQTFNNRYNFPVHYYAGGYAVEEMEGKYFIFSNTGDTLIKYAVHVLDLQGNLLESAKFYADSTAQFNGYSNTSDKYDGGVISAGTIVYPDQSKDGQIIKWANSADTVATKKIVANGNYTVVILQQAKAVSDGFVAVGSIANNNIERILLVKTDFDLNEIWRREYGSTSIPHAGYSVVQTPDGGYLLGGARKINDTWDHCVVKTSPTGEQEYLKSYGNEYKCYYAMVANGENGQYYYGGRLRTGEMYLENSQVCKLNSELDTLWCKTYGNTGADCRVNSLKKLTDGNLVACGSDRSTGVMFGYIMKLDPDGNALWYRKYAQMEGNWCYFQDVIQTTDGGYFLTGTLTPEIGFTQDVWGIKLDSYGCLEPGCQFVNVEEVVVGLQNTMSIYPNPANDIVHIKFDLPPHFKEMNSRLVVINMQGQTVLEEELSPSSFISPVQLNLSQLASGLYTVHWVREGAWLDSATVVKN